MLDSLGDIVECPICLETMGAPIRQCKNGHSICDGCASRINRCPLCKSPITNARNYQLEKVIANLKEISNNNISCKYVQKGCKMKSNKDHIESHEVECKHREYVCEGKKFAKWNCNWKGDYENIFHHFKADHNKHTWMEFQTSVHLKVDLTRNFLDIQIIPYNKGEKLFWYKHKIDVEKEKAYWLFQHVGPVVQARKYFYEFIIRHGPIRITKIREMCESDTKNVNEIFDSGKCVAIPFYILNTYSNEDHEIAFTFRIGEVKESCEDFGNQNVKQFINNVCNNNTGANPTPPPNTNTLQGQQIQYQPVNGPHVNYTIPPNNFQCNGPQFFPYPGMPPSAQFGAPYNTGFQGPPPQMTTPFLYVPAPAASYIRPDLYQQQQSKK